MSLIIDNIKEGFFKNWYQDMGSIYLLLQYICQCEEAYLVKQGETSECFKCK